MLTNREKVEIYDLLANRLRHRFRDVLEVQEAAEHLEFALEEFLRFRDMRVSRTKHESHLLST